MSIKKLICSALSIAMVILVGCKQSPYDNAISYIDELSNEVMTATNDSVYEVVYNKIVTLNTSEVMTNLNGLSQEQSQTIKQKTAGLMLEALAVKAILYVMPKDITPTSEDMKKLADECIQNKLNVLVAPYGDVRALVHEYYHIAN